MKAAELLAKRIKELKDERRLTQRQVADLLGVSQSHISQVLNSARKPRSQRKTLSIAVIDRLAKALDTTLADLFRETADQSGQYSLTTKERRLVDAFRDADDRFKQVALAALGAETLKLEIEGPQVTFRAPRTRTEEARP